MEDKLTQGRLKELLKYSPESGVFTWKVARGIKIKAGDIAGSMNTSNGKNYINIGVDNKKHYAHRLAWLYMTGSYPIQVDHEDHDGLNNKWVNLRSTDSSGNHKNMTLGINSSTGVSGVHFVKRRGNYQAYLTVDCKRQHLGTYPSIEEASAARTAAEVSFGFHPNHGKAKQEAA